MADTLTILSSVAVSTIVTASLVWLSKSWISERLKNAIKNEYDEKLETHKAKLKAEADTSVERLKCELQIAASERNVRYSRIFERQATTIADLYTKLLSYYEALKEYTKFIETSGDLPRSERLVALNKANRDFYDCFRVNKLYLPKETVDQIEAFHNELTDVRFNFLFGVDLPLLNRAPNAETTKQWTMTVDSLNKELPALLRLLEDDFRGILGTMRHVK
jgi:hypothetical protein